MMIGVIFPKHKVVGLRSWDLCTFH